MLLFVAPCLSSSPLISFLSFLPLPISPPTGPPPLYQGDPFLLITIHNGVYSTYFKLELNLILKEEPDPNHNSLQFFKV